MTAFKLIATFFVLVSIAGPTLADPTGQSPSRAVHGRRNLCRPRLSPAPQRPTPSHVPYSANTTAYTSQALPTPTSDGLESSSSSNASMAPESTPQPYVDLTPSALSSYNAFVASPSSSFTPNRIKAGVAAGDAYNILRDHIGWWYDWSANPSKPGKPIAVPMLWGSGKVDATDAKRLAQFKRLVSSSSRPQFVLGYEEPDCVSGSGSSGMSVDEGVRLWEALIAPLRKRGTKVGSPSMCS